MTTYQIHVGCIVASYKENDVLTQDGLFTTQKSAEELHKFVVRQKLAS